jgi:hypothetical protein
MTLGFFIGIYHPITAALGIQSFFFQDKKSWIQSQLSLLAEMRSEHCDRLKNTRAGKLAPPHPLLSPFWG